MNKSHRTGLLLGLLIPVAIWAANAALPFTFSSGGAIRASEINANFNALRDAINAGSSGSRLKVLALRGVDGFTQEFGTGISIVWDSQLQISCSLLGGQGRCAPVYNADYFSDATCTTRVARLTAQTAGTYLAGFGADAGAPEQPRFATSSSFSGGSQTVTFYRLGSAQSGPTFALTNFGQGLPDGGSITGTRCDATGTFTFYPTTGIEPASTFASIEVVLR